MNFIHRICANRLPLKNIILQQFKRFIPAISDYGRPHYKYCLENAVSPASSLGKSRISVIEFGVAGGNGLVCIKNLCEHLSRKYSIDFDIFGFDIGSGLPRPVDFRDQPYLFGEGFYRMGIEALKNKLSNAKLVIGNFSEITKSFLMIINRLLSDVSFLISIITLQPNQRWKFLIHQMQ